MKADENSIQKIKNLLVTGKPGCGKTTLLVNLLRERSKTRGFYTEEKRRGNARVGFAIKTIEGKYGTLAEVGLRSKVQIGRYGVNTKDIDNIMVPEIMAAIADDDVSLILIDEIGGMEISSENFRKAVLAALDSEKRVLATIQMKKNPFLDAIRSRKDVRIVELTPTTREDLRVKILSWLEFEEISNNTKP